ncbi:MAG: hypothetical protein WA825_14510 [Steroidobacteraceae bacterium]
MPKPWMLWTSAAIAMALPCAGLASDGRIDFIGVVATPTCTLVVSDVGTSGIVNGIGNQGRTTLNLPAATATFLSISAADCDAAVDTTKVGSATLVSIYFETVNSVDQQSAGIISIVYE